MRSVVKAHRLFHFLLTVSLPLFFSSLLLVYSLLSMVLFLRNSLLSVFRKVVIQPICWLPSPPRYSTLLFSLPEEDFLLLRIKCCHFFPVGGHFRRFSFRFGVLWVGFDCYQADWRLLYSVLSVQSLWGVDAGWLCADRG